MSKRGTIVEKINIPIYNFDLYLVISEDLNHGIAQLENEFGKQQDFGAANAAATLSNGEGIFAMCFTFNFLTNGIISHETRHLIKYINKQIGHKPDLNHDEPEAYLTTWCTDFVYSILNKKKIPVKLGKI